MNEDSAFGPGMMFGIPGPGPKRDTKGIPSNPKMEKGIEIDNKKKKYKMKNINTFEEFINERFVNEELSILSNLDTIKSAMEKSEAYVKKNGGDLKGLQKEYTTKLKGAVAEMITRSYDKKSNEEVNKFLKKIEGSTTFTSMIDLVTFYAEKYNVNESLLEAEKWEMAIRDFTTKVGEWLRQGFTFTFERVIIPFVKYILNVLSRLVINVVIAIVNTITGKTYTAPNATIFKKAEFKKSETISDEEGAEFEPEELPMEESTSVKKIHPFNRFKK